ncbi:transposase [Paraburkholderia azotifigens]|uniref:IS66-like element accessory protein TnpA n=1 Tax=Paraburkholderia azotifigens TaxID=2057004 RepID=UPI0031746863
MHDNLDDFLPLRATGVNADGKRRFDEREKQRLIEACQRPGVSIAGLALKAGVNANVLWRWVRKHNTREESLSAETNATESAPSAFVPVKEILDTGTLVVPQRPEMPEALPAPVSLEAVKASQRAALPSRLVAQLPNGVSLELQCMGEDAELVTAMIAALRGR